MNDKERQQLIEKSEDGTPPGYYYSNMVEYPGYIVFPHPVSYPQFRIWWSLAVEELSMAPNPLAFNHWHGQWKAARELILKFGQWKVSGVLVGDVERDEVPLEVEEWVLTSARNYILPRLDPKKAHVLRTVM